MNESKILSELRVINEKLDVLEELIRQIGKQIWEE